jgi:osmoprotectant transport system ATP-binding protein
MYPIIFKNLSHKYGTAFVLENIDLAIENDKITVILGTSGGGKSTLLQMINGLLKPTKGSVEVYGKPIDYDNIYPLRRSMGYSVQGTGLFPHLTTFENIALLAKISNVPGQGLEQKIEDLMNLVNLDLNYKNKYPYELSGGEQQRVGICRAMILDPPIFLLDEAFGALDISTRKELQSELLKLQKTKPRTIILVTHDVDEAFVLADKILILHQGRVQQYDPPHRIKNHPSNLFVNQFLQR